MINFPSVKTTFKWTDLHKRIVRIVVAEPNPECLEPYGRVYAQDLESDVIYLLAEYGVANSKARGET